MTAHSHRNPWWVIGWRILALGPAILLIYLGRFIMAMGGFTFKGVGGWREIWSETDVL